jgi:broad specificity phosphatase PhoE
MTAPVYLVRHGEALNPDHVVYADLPGFGLSDRGRRQVAATARRLGTIEAVVSSPLRRATQTAAVIAEANGVVPIVDDDLTEWLLLGRWRGHRWEALDAAFPGEVQAYLDDPTDLPFSPESLGDMARRSAGATRRWRSNSTGPLVIVSHQDPVQAARLTLTGRPVSGLHHEKPEHASIIELAPGESEWTEQAYWTP